MTESWQACFPIFWPSKGHTKVVQSINNAEDLGQASRLQALKFVDGRHSVKKCYNFTICIIMVWGDNNKLYLRMTFPWHRKPKKCRNVKLYTFVLDQRGNKISLYYLSAGTCLHKKVYDGAGQTTHCFKSNEWNLKISSSQLKTKAKRL